MSPAIVVHGGAGTVAAERRDLVEKGCARAARAGYSILVRGGTALDAVIAAVEVMEEDPEFNAGRGSALNRAGEIEVDACVMTGERDVGAVAAVPWLRHPARLAGLVLQDGEHILLAGNGALAFARRHGITPDAPEDLISERARARFRDASDRRGDTVGACALDRSGRVAAATSTGGIARKRPGRIGDTPLPGAGTWADAGIGAASATGLGEAIIRALTSKRAMDLLGEGRDPDAAARIAVDEIESIGRGTGGVILLDRNGRAGFACNTQAMPWATVHDGRPRSGILVTPT